MIMREALKEAASRLGELADTPQGEARLLACCATGQTTTWLRAHPETELSPAQFDAFNRLLERRLEGEPLPYILGHWEFFGLDFELTPDVLIPRPETELLLEAAIAWAHEQHITRAIDVGTGCGCIAVTLAVHCPGVQVIATDISGGALAVAARNAEKHGVQDRLTLMECDLFPTTDNTPRAFDLIVSNPPYIPTEIMRGLPVFGREPTLALDGGPDGMQVISRLLDQARGQLHTGRLLLVEIESSLGPAVLSLARKYFPGARLEVRKDLLGLDRLLVVRDSRGAPP